MTGIFSESKVANPERFLDDSVRPRPLLSVPIEPTTREGGIWARIAEIVMSSATRVAIIFRTEDSLSDVISSFSFFKGKDAILSLKVRACDARDKEFIFNKNEKDITAAAIRKITAKVIKYGV